MYDYKGEKDIIFIVMDEDMFDDDVVGSCRVQVDDFFRTGKFSGLIRLEYKNRKAGDLYVEIDLIVQKSH